MGQRYVVEQFCAVSSGAKVVHEHYSPTMLEEPYEGPQGVRMFCGFKFECQPNTLDFAVGRSPVQSSRVRQTKLYKFSYASTVSLGLLSSLTSMDTLLDRERMLLMSGINAERPAC
jgi:hypothetical protein